MDTLEQGDWKNQQCYINLKEDAKFIYNLIDKYHIYFSRQDNRYRVFVRILKILILFLSMTSTIILGLKTVINIDLQVILGLILSAVMTFITAISSYFNFEEYWMRNITIHIELNILRNNFIFDTKSENLDDIRVKYYRDKLNEIQQRNIQYWQKAIKRV